MDEKEKADRAQETSGKRKKHRETNNEEELAPPSPIQIPPEEAYTPEFDLPDPQDLRRMDPETRSRLKAFLDVAGVKLSHLDSRTFQDPEILRKLTNRWAIAALKRLIKREKEWIWSRQCPVSDHFTHVMTRSFSDSSFSATPIWGKAGVRNRITAVIDTAVIVVSMTMYVGMHAVAGCRGTLLSILTLRHAGDPSQHPY